MGGGVFFKYRASSEKMLIYTRFAFGLTPPHSHSPEFPIFVESLPFR